MDNCFVSVGIVCINVGVNPKCKIENDIAGMSSNKNITTYQYANASSNNITRWIGNMIRCDRIIQTFNKDVDDGDTNFVRIYFKTE